jgi:hypothetical protein
LPCLLADVYVSAGVSALVGLIDIVLGGLKA